MSHNITPETIRKRLDEIRANSHDFEFAHMLEDRLRADVLLAIANATSASMPFDHARGIARMALETDTIVFQRAHA